MNLSNKKTVLLLLFILIGIKSVTAQQITGTVIDAETNEPIPYLNVYYEGKGIGSITDDEGHYSVPTHTGWTKLTFSSVGYVTKIITVIPGKSQKIDVKIKSESISMSEVVVKPKREKYSRKNNPAVELMKKVIAAKKESNLDANPYYQYNKYQKITLSLNDIKPESLNNGMFKKYPFLKDQVETCQETNKLILPISVDETVSQKIYRKSPKSEKTIIKGQNSTGVNELFNTGDILTTTLKDVFTDVNIYNNDIRLLQYPFTSPISSSGAISFYKYYIMDTLYVEKEKCFHLTFVPQNSQDFGFTGHLYILADSSYQIKRCILNLPKKSDVNFVDNLSVIQEFEQLPSGERILKTDDMITELTFGKMFQKFQVRRTTKYSDFAFDDLPKQLFRKKGSELKEADAMMRDDTFWEQYRQIPLTKSENSMGSFIDNLGKIKGFRYIIFGMKAFIENFVETGNPSKLDIGPVNTMVTSNFVDGLRLRASAQTTANLNKHFFLKGYTAYGFKDKKWKYSGTMEYSFNKKEYLPREFPKDLLSFTYQYDVMSPVDKFLQTDKDNIFVGFKTSTVDQMMYVRSAELKYEKETQYGLTLTASMKNANDEPTGNLTYTKMNGDLVHDITTSEISVGLRYAPGETFINTKQRRLPINLDAPIFSITHTMGFNRFFGGNYKYNLTEINLYKRIWLNSFGKIDTYIKGGAQWNKVPFPLLIMPAANNSYVIQYETFNLINNMEFLNDRYASLDIAWDMNGKVLNRIPLLKKLKWREYIGFKMLWGNLTDKNNPYLNPDDTELFQFPMRNGHYTSFVMDNKQPYMEFCAGVHNIFKILHVEYVRRLNYLNNYGVHKDGIRFMVRMTF